VKAHDTDAGVHGSLPVHPDIVAYPQEPTAAMSK
jgi:hypothetical protein